MAIRTSETDFARYVTRFLTNNLPGERNLSPQTIKSYSFAIKQYIVFLGVAHKLKPERIELKDVTADTVRGFLNSMGTEISPATSNQRLSAIKAFVRYAILESPPFLLNGQRILAIASKRCHANEIEYLEMEAMRALLAAPNQSTAIGRRDLAILALLYDSGSRVQEIIDLKVKDVRLEKPETITLTGKGRKTRSVPIMAETASIVGNYLKDCGVFELSGCGDLRLFRSPNRNQFTRPGIAKILKRHLAAAKTVFPDVLFPQSIHPHMLRTSKAIHLLDAGIDILRIRDFLGHASISTTQVYLRVNSEAKREAITRAYPPLGDSAPGWREDRDLMKLLKELCS